MLDDVDLDPLAIVEESAPAGWRREWCMPAELLNDRATVTLVDDAERDEIAGVDEVERQRVAKILRDRDPERFDRVTESLRDLDGRFGSLDPSSSHIWPAALADSEPYRSEHRPLAGERNHLCGSEP